MITVKFDLKFTVEGKEFTYSSTEQVTEKEMLGAERPQLFFDYLCRSLEKRANDKAFKKRLGEIKIDHEVSKHYLPSQKIASTSQNG